MGKRKFVAMSETTDDSGTSGEEDFISLNLGGEDEPKSRQERRHHERKESKRKREKDDSEQDNLVCCPWMELMDSTAPEAPHKRLQKEVECFLRYMEPTEAERQLREYLVHKIRWAVQSRYSEDVEVHVFGSFGSNLYLPNSDIDVVVCTPPHIQVTLRNLARVLENAGVCSSPQVIEKAMVPVIKFRDLLTDLPVDIVIDSTSGLGSGKVIRQMMKKQPALRPLTLIIKHFLALHDLNEVFTGGIGGYATVCLVMSFLQIHPKLASGRMKAENNLGVLLLDFLQLYGHHFSMDTVGICPKTASYFQTNGRNLSMRGHRHYFSIRDPDCLSNDLGCKSFNSYHVRSSFNYSYLVLSRKMFQMYADWQGKRDRCGVTEEKFKRVNWDASLLGSILTVSMNVMDQRERIHRVYTDKSWLREEAASTFKLNQEKC
ncbi:uncharacterized protein BYT42DRAFT_609416 [Radiomyces spectabilis]|uniref:uncharacterized protein n=1 Tax=Radiomyces spectabilis TaxID=64574 RepID=UPI00221E7394|nr:uncharacterized protein BYT42DRAFT_609416 [Radiomyces spectabilis]KAI8393642.1 hypothetical protein BYT42DRAFT_609416 [Radiomyces spectabilis]